ncbi:MAG: DUF2203 domain-containing protein [Deltaproteobacteria bacterium]|nr:DUF2203 domain-containing protein [Deltaproteobacteria bacterium]
MRNPGENPPPRYFTPAEANALLPRLRFLMTKVSENGRRIREHLGKLQAGPTPAVRDKLQGDVDRLKEEVGRAVAEIQSLGVEVKSVDTGLLDFPALKNGERVYLCWREGEERVEWWHPIHTGYSGRQRVTMSGVRWEWKN